MALLASTRRIFAPGAMAWAHSTSSSISPAQPELAVGKVVVEAVPEALMPTFVKLGGAAEAELLGRRRSGRC